MLVGAATAHLWSSTVQMAKIQPASLGLAEAFHAKGACEVASFRLENRLAGLFRQGQVFKLRGFSCLPSTGTSKRLGKLETGIALLFPT